MAIQKMTIGELLHRLLDGPSEATITFQAQPTACDDEKIVLTYPRVIERLWNVDRERVIEIDINLGPSTMVPDEPVNVDIDTTYEKLP